MLQLKLLSSLEKCFPDEEIEKKQEGPHQISLLKNEIFSFQICYQHDEVICPYKAVHLHVESPLKERIRISRVQPIASLMPVYQPHCDENYLRTTPGLYPDLLQPLRSPRLITDHLLRSVWIEIDPQGEIDAGTYPIKCTFTKEKDGSVMGEVELYAEIINADLPHQTLINTQWFYTDCLMQYYHTEAFDERHWKIIENFMRSARKYGQNMILTPVLSPELDTYVGGYRPVTQLVGITKKGDEYTFDFSKLGRWVDLCDKVGIEYFEICHLYSQWGAVACPQVIATVDGKEERIFGWDTPSDGEEYKAFLSALIPAMLKYLKEEKNGADKRCWFHLSDEPNEDHLKQYKVLSDFLKPLLKGYPIMDALSEFEYYKQGLVDHPIAATNAIEPFLEAKVPELWAYTCCAQAKEVSNRFIAMPSARNRIMGVQLYKYEIFGFLQWGFNFYNNEFSYETVNPFLCSDGENFVQSGDAYAVYPGPDEHPYSSIRQLVFHEAIQDMRALQLCESLYGKDAVMKVIEEGIEPITFKQYPHSADYLLTLRRRINDMIKEKVTK